MNALIEMFHPNAEKQVLEKDMLFATLETSVRNIPLPDKKEFLLTDTVGFVSRLPHHLVRAFRSTLEEVVEADLLIHVVDFSNPDHEQQMDITEQTLNEIGIKGIPTIFAYNKADLTDLEIPRVNRNSVYMSAKTKAGLEELIEQIREQIFTDYIRCEMLIPFDQGQLVSFFNENGHITDTEYEESGYRIKLECKKADYEKYIRYVIKSE